ncbi:MAG: ribosomal-processing cysteine protease Prp [Lachnospiraceae bacterium]|nr:ribosomal-processing cysteine protease Prp [Lachnospiraceae bacterium]
MTTITIFKSGNGNYKRILCEGHAEFAKPGRDIVCSAVSMLVINTINSLDELLKVPMQVDSDEEKGLIDCQFTENLDGKGRLLVDSMILGLEGVVSQYGRKYLKLKFKEV